MLHIYCGSSSHVILGFRRGEYTEAQRLRNLSNAIQATFYEQCAGSNDNDNIMNRVQSISRGKDIILTWQYSNSELALHC